MDHSKRGGVEHSGAHDARDWESKNQWSTVNLNGTLALLVPLVGEDLDGALERQLRSERGRRLLQTRHNEESARSRL